MDSTVDISTPAEKEVVIESPTYNTLKQISNGVTICRLHNGNYVLSAHEGGNRVLVEMTDEDYHVFAQKVIGFSRWFKARPTDGETFPLPNSED